MSTSAKYDLGLGKVILVTDASVQATEARYDEFGRLTHLRKPPPEELENESPPWSVLVSYDLATAARPYSIVTTSVQDSEQVMPTATYLTTQAHVDGMGRTRYVRSEADTTRGDDAPWIDSELVAFDAKGALARKYLPYFTTGSLSPTHSATVRYDAFGREVETTDFGGVTTLKTYYHALSTDAWDAADLQNDIDPNVVGDQPGPHYGTYASVRKDGHGRVVATTERIKINNVVEAREVRSRYLPTGEVKAITRVRVGSSSPPVLRWMRYDSLGRMIVNVDPNTTDGFTDNADATVTSTLKTYRYAYSDAGDLVGWSDARGCGVNYFYDRAGRLVAEDYSPCVQEHITTLPPYSAPNLTTLDGIEVYYKYDSVPISFGSLPQPAGYVGTSPLLQGRLAAVFDRGSLTYLTYDARGRSTRTDRAIAHPDVLLTNLADRYQAPWFSKQHSYDAMDRLLTETTGAASPEFLNASQVSSTSVEYSARGTVSRVSSTYGSLVNSIHRSADGLIEEIVYGDAAATTSTQGYDDRRRLEAALVARDAPGIWSSPAPAYQPAPSPLGPPSFQEDLRADVYEYDIVGNPTAITDARLDADWPAGAKPVSRQIKYDDLYRVTEVAYAYGTSTDSWVSPFAPELNGSDDPRRPDDFPSHLTLATRPEWQRYEYDWLGSVTKSSDDLNAFWDRGMGPMRNGVSNRAYQWNDAGTLADPNWTGNGYAQAADYDAAGNLEQINIVRSGACTNGTTNCDLRFYYYFDEIGRLYRGTRYEGQTLKADLSFIYDSSDNRVIKTDNTLPGTVNDAHTLYVFDSLELRRTSHDAATETYSRTVENEVPYLIANGVRVARVVYEGAADGEPRLDGSSRLHVFLNIGDHLGSTSIVIDRATSELVERTTYQPYGATESDYRPERWKGFRDDYRFTGKEEDQEIGVTYFGKRFLSPYLGRWVTPDPLAVHAPGEADLNLYAYVHGSVLKNVDPMGLADQAAAWDNFEVALLSGGQNTDWVQNIRAQIKFTFTLPEGSPGQVLRFGGWRGDAQYKVGFSQTVMDRMARMPTSPDQPLGAADTAAFGTFLHEAYHMHMHSTRSDTWWGEARRAVGNVRLESGGHASGHRSQTALVHEMMASYVESVGSATYAAQRALQYHHARGSLFSAVGKDGTTNFDAIQASYLTSIRKAQSAPMGYVTRDSDGAAKYDNALDPVPKILQEEANQDMFGEGHTSPMSFRELSIKATGDPAVGDHAQ